MTYQEYIHLLAERSAVGQFLADLPADEILERSSWDARLQEIEDLLAKFTQVGRPPARARLTFRGRPVIGSYGIFAEFGTRATGAFTDIVAKVAAALSGPLAATGPVPNRDQSQFLITSTALGSFGFELEEYHPGQVLFEDDTAAAQALEQTRQLLQSTLGTDEDLADAVAATDPRAVEALRTFLDVLGTNEAVCALQYEGHVFQFRDVGEVRRSRQRLDKGNLQENETRITGAFHGVLPNRRTFEFRLADSGDVIGGKVGPAVSDPASINNHLLQPVTITVLSTRVGSGRPRYVLIAPPEWANGA